MNAKLTIAILALALVALAGCQVDLQANNTTITELNESELMDLISFNDTNVTQEEKPDVDESKASYTITATEGDLVEIPVKAVDPDGDFIEYKFSEPFNDDGLWQSNIGDEGKYLVKVTASDGKLSSSEFVLINLLRANRPPTIECPEELEVQETEKVVIDCNVFDVDGDPVIVGYDGWMKTSTYTTTYGDAGEHTVLVRARDKDKESVKEVTVKVTKKNRAPVITGVGDMTVQETQTAKIDVSTSDPDGDKVTVTYGKPFNKNGEWKTGYEDEGEYEVTVTASDGQTETKETFKLTVEGKNRAPVLKPLDTIEVDEGDKITLKPSAYDPDGDDVAISYSGWMTSSEYTTTYDDAHPDGCNEKGCTATYTVKVTATDGELSETQTVTIKVKDKNRPPQFIFG